MPAKLTDLIATRERSIDFAALGYLLPNPDPILKARGIDIATYRDLRSDAHVGGCIRRRKSAVKALERGFDREQARSRVARALEDLFADLDLDRIIGEALDACLYGYQPLEIVWRRVGSLIVPTDIVGKPPEWFGFDAANNLRFKSRQAMAQGEELPPKKFLLPRQDATYQNPYGFPDLSLCYWPTVFKKGGVKYWLQFTEKFGSAFAVGKLPRTASPTERAELLDSLDALIGNGVATVPDDGSVELVEMAGKSASADLYERLVMYCRSEVSIALTGTNQTTEANSNRASATAGLEVADDLRDGDAEIVAAAFNQLIAWVVELNWPGAERPSWSLWDQEARDQLQAERDASNVKAGAKLTNAYWMRAYGYQEGDLQPDLAAPATPDVAPATANVATQAAHARTPPFAKGGAGGILPAPTDPDLAQLAAATAAPWQALLGEIEAMAAAATDGAELQLALTNAYGHLDTGELTRLMAAAFALAELRGIDAVRGEDAA